MGLASVEAYAAEVDFSTWIMLSSYNFKKWTFSLWNT